jgi:hypothetical protein
MHKEMLAKTENVTSENVDENTDYPRKAVYTVSWRKGFSITVHTILSLHKSYTQFHLTFYVWRRCKDVY